VSLKLTAEVEGWVTLPVLVRAAVDDGSVSAATLVDAPPLLV